MWVSGVYNWRVRRSVAGVSAMRRDFRLRHGGAAAMILHRCAAAVRFETAAEMPAARNRLPANVDMTVILIAGAATGLSRRQQSK